MAWGWKWIADITGPPGDAAALGRFDATDAAIRSMRAQLLVSAEDTKYAHIFPDKDGRNAGGVTKAGRFNFEKAPTVQGVEGTALQPMHAPGYAWAWPDRDGHFSFGIRDDGTVEIHKGGSAVDALALANTMAGFTRSDRTRVACFGDSLTNGYYGGTSGHTADAYPAKLQALVPAGVTVFNVSTSGRTVDEVAVRIGALALPITVTGGSIPASGPVGVTTTTTVGWGPGVRSYTGTLAGIPGVLNRADGATTTLAFARTTAGSATAVTPGTIFVPDQAGHDTDTAVIFLGRNDIGYNVTGAEATVAEHIAAGVQRIVDWLSRDIKQVIIVSVTTTTLETAGTAGYTTVTSANTLMQAKNPTRYLDLRGYLVNQAIHDLGITPTPGDLSNMAADTLPPSIMDPGSGGTGDVTHYSMATAGLVADQMYNYLTPRDWIKS